MGESISSSGPLLLPFSSLESSIDSLLSSSPSPSPQLLLASLASLAWLFDAQQTFITVFSASPSLPSSSFFLGSLFGGLLLSALADSRLGRRKTLLLSSLLMSLSAALSAIPSPLLLFSLLRFLAGFARSAVGTSALVLSTELVARRWRDRVSIAGFICFTFGFLSLPALAYASRDCSWRILYILTAGPALLYTAVLYFLMEESPRWLLLKGRTLEAAEAINRLMGDGEVADVASILAAHHRQDDELILVESDNIFSSAKFLWSNRCVFRRLVSLMTVSFGVGMVYFGMPLSLGNLSSNLYLSVSLNALAELPSSLLVFFLISRMNRRASTLAFSAASAFFSLACAAAPAGWPQMASELAAFFSACTAFSFVLIYSIELFPTCVRNSAIAVVRQALVLGGAVAPLLVAEGRRRRVLSFGVFGLAIGFCGAFATCLPETREKGMSDAEEEVGKGGRC